MRCRYAVVLAFDVRVERDAQEMADQMGVKIFSADIIYHLFDKFTAYREVSNKSILFIVSVIILLCAYVTNKTVVRTCYDQYGFQGRNRAFLCTARPAIRQILEI